MASVASGEVAGADVAVGAGRGFWRYGVAGLVALGVGIRLWHLGRESIWLDEGYSIFYARMPAAQMIEMIFRQDPTPPLYYLVLHYWMRLFGDSEASVRTPSLLAGVACIPLIYLIGRRLLSRRAGLLAALLATISSFHIYHSQDARGYSLLTLLFDYYSRRPGLNKRGIGDPDDPVTPQNVGRLVNAVGSAKRVWLIYHLSSDPHRLLPQALGEQYRMLDTPYRSDDNGEISVMLLERR